MSSLAQPILINQQLYGFLKFGQKDQVNYYLDLNYNYAKRFALENIETEPTDANKTAGYMFYNSASSYNSIGFFNGTSFVYPMTSTNVLNVDNSIGISRADANATLSVKLRTSTASGLLIDTNASNGGLYVSTSYINDQIDNYFVDSDSILFDSANNELNLNIKSGEPLHISSVASSEGLYLATNTNHFLVDGTTGTEKLNLKFNANGAIVGITGLEINDGDGLEIVDNALKVKALNSSISIASGGISVSDSYVQGVVNTYFTANVNAPINYTGNKIGLSLYSSDTTAPSIATSSTGDSTNWSGLGVTTDNKLAIKIPTSNSGLKLTSTGLSVKIDNTTTDCGGLKYSGDNGLSLNPGLGLQIDNSVEAITHPIRVKQGTGILVDDDGVSINPNYVTGTVPIVVTDGNVELKLPTVAVSGFSGSSFFGGLGVTTADKLAIKLGNNRGINNGLALDTLGLHAYQIAIGNLLLTETSSGSGIYYFDFATANVRGRSPSASNDFATKSYVDNLAQGVKWKSPCDCATTGNITLSGEQTIDTVVLVAGQRVLVKDQTDPTTNGIYVVSTGAWARDELSNTGDEITKSATFILGGLENIGNTYVNTNTSITEWTTDITYILMSSNANSYSAGDAIDIANNAISVLYDDATIVKNGSNKLEVGSIYRTKHYEEDWTQGASTSYTVTHNLGSTDVQVQVFMEVTYATSPSTIYRYIEVETLVVIESATSVKIEFSDGLTSFVTGKNFRIKVIG